MAEGNNGLNDVIIHSDILEEYIRNKHLSYGIISSTTKCLHSIEKLENECKGNYKLVVADYRLNRNPELFGIKEIGKLEVLVIAYCRDFCSEREEHYHALSMRQLTYSDKSSYHRCPYVLEDFETVRNSRKSFITIGEIRNVYHQKGIENYKIEGRTNSWVDVLESYLYYLVKPEYRNEVRSYHCPPV